MKKFIVLIFIIILANSAAAAEIGLEGVEKSKIKMTPKVTHDEKNLLMDKDKAMKELLAQQQKKTSKILKTSGNQLSKTTILSNSPCANSPHRPSSRDFIHH